MIRLERTRHRRDQILRWALLGCGLAALVFAARPAAAQGDFSNESCLGCHATPGMTADLPSGEKIYLSIDPAIYESSVHGQMGYACIQCHTEIDDFPHDPVTARDRREYAFQRYNASCVLCHSDKYDLTLDSVHQKALAAGNLAAPICTDCHGAHDIARADDPPSRSSQMCQRCHSTIFDVYSQSVHGSALIGQGNHDVPSCTNCHGVHAVQGPQSQAGFYATSYQVCAECHSDPVLMAGYGLRADVYDTFVADFHGTTVVLYGAGSPEQPLNKPVCVDCHGVHDIQAHDAPTSRVMKENLLETCQRCHPDATINFPDSWLSHYRPDRENAPAVFFVDLFYKVMIPTVLGAMVFFNLTDVGRRLTDWLRRRKESSHD